MYTGLKGSGRPWTSTVLVDAPHSKNLKKKENLQSDTNIVYNYQERKQQAVTIKFTDFFNTIQW
jgi:hypothetical protein